MAIMPGVAWRPIPVSSSRPRRTKGRGVCLHVAVSEAASLFPYFSTANVDSHFYVAKSGTIEQYVDTDLVAYAQLVGNATLISVETQGGVTNPDSEPWTAPQVDALARICRWAHDIEGVPLQVMPDSRPTSRGLGSHRLGIDPWRVSGGELWSTANGKLCPGAAKVAQIPQIRTRADQIVGGDDMPLTDVDIEKIAQRTRQVIADGRLPYGLDSLRRRLDVLEQLIITADANDDSDALAAAIVAAIPADLAQQVVNRLAERLTA
jgi:hypothetical protein